MSREPGIREIIALLIALALTIVAFVMTGCNGLRKENERLREELAKAQQYVPLQRDTIRDTVEVVTQEIVEVEKIKNVLTSEDKQLLKDIGVKVRELETLQKTGIETRDTIFLVAKDSTKDAPLVYHDAWTDIEYENKKLTYAMKDSLAIAVKKEYKRRFLWWRWGVKGYEVKVMNFNPHSTVRYNTFVKRKE